MAVNARAGRVAHWALTAGVVAGQVNLPVVAVVMKAVNGETWDLDEFVGLHGCNSTVWVESYTKTRSEPVRLTSPWPYDFRV